MDAEDRQNREDEIRLSVVDAPCPCCQDEDAKFLLAQLDRARAEEQEACAWVLEKRADELRLKFGPMDDAAGELNLQALAIRTRHHLPRVP
jgi:hypothetical protein